MKTQAISNSYYEIITCIGCEGLTYTTSHILGLLDFGMNHNHDYLSTLETSWIY